MRAVLLKRLAVVMLCLAFLGGAFWIAIHADRGIVEDNDFFTFWLGARMTWTGQDAYDPLTWVSESQMNDSIWIPNPVYIYPLPLSILMAPLGLVSVRLAYMLWIFMTMVGITSAFLLLLSLWKLPTAGAYVIPLFLGLLLNRGVFNTIRNGQLGGIFLFLLALTVVLWDRKKWFLGGMCICLVILKPQIGLPIVGLCGIWLMVQRRWSAIGGMMLVGLFLVGIGSLHLFDWPVEFIQISIAKVQTVFGYSPTLWGAAHLVCQDNAGCTQALGLGLTALLSLGTGTLLVVRRDKIGPDLAISLMVCCAVLVTPYLWAYDHVILVLPFMVLAGRMVAMKWPFLFSATWMIQVGLLSYILVIIAMARASDEWSVALPVFCLGLLMILFKQELFGGSGIRREIGKEPLSI